MITAHLTVFEDGKEIGKMAPARWFYRKHEEEPTTETAIRRRPGQDLYLTLASFELSDQSVNLEIFVNPLVNWIWLGFAVMAIGTGLCLLPERTFAFAMSKFPAEAAGTAGATTAMILLLLFSLARPVLAQQHQVVPGTVIAAPKNALEQELREEMGCTCGTCAHEPLTHCTCSEAQGMRDALRAQIDLGKDKTEILSHFMAVYGGQQFLSAPIDAGFNRLAWLFPYALAGTIAVIGGVVVIKKSRSTARLPQGEKPVQDAALEARLDEELQDLD
jgi:cytochrome c-type biogenesis protein CcmF